MNLNEFLDLTPRQFFNAVGGFVEREEVKLRESWEQTRIILASIENKEVYGYKVRKKEPQKLLPFPWDEKNFEVDKETIEQLKKEMTEHNNKVKWQPQ